MATRENASTTSRLRRACGARISCWDTGTRLNMVKLQWNDRHIELKLFAHDFTRDAITRILAADKTKPLYIYTRESLPNPAVTIGEPSGHLD